MSLELQDLPQIKVHQEVHALLKASSVVNQKDINVLVREIIHLWASKQFDVLSMANEIAKSKGLTGITGEWSK